MELENWVAVGGIIAAVMAVAAFLVSLLNWRRDDRRDRANIRFNIEAPRGEWELVNHGPSEAFAVGVVWHGESSKQGTLVNEPKVSAGEALKNKIQLPDEGGSILIEWRDSTGAFRRRFLRVPAHARGHFGNAHPIMISEIRAGLTLRQIRRRIFVRAWIQGSPWRKLR